MYSWRLFVVAGSGPGHNALTPIRGIDVGLRAEYRLLCAGDGPPSTQRMGDEKTSQVLQTCEVSVLRNEGGFLYRLTVGQGLTWHRPAGHLA